MKVFNLILVTFAMKQVSPLNFPGIRFPSVSAEHINNLCSPPFPSESYKHKHNPHLSAEPHNRSLIKTNNTPPLLYKRTNSVIHLTVSRANTNRQLIPNSNAKIAPPERHLFLIALVHIHTILTKENANQKQWRNRLRVRILPVLKLNAIALFFQSVWVVQLRFFIVIQVTIKYF